MKKGVFAAFLAICVLFFAGCPQSARDYFAFRREGFRAEVRGELEEMDFCAEIEVEAESDGWCVRVEYLEPALLEHTEIRAVCDAQGEIFGEAELWRGESRFSVEGEMLRGLLLPATVWISCEEIVSVQKTEDGYVLSLGNGVSLQIGDDGDPREVRAGDFSMEIVWLERGAA